MRALPTTLALNRELREYLALQKTKNQSLHPRGYIRLKEVSWNVE
jgi:hypothetical protein